MFEKIVKIWGEKYFGDNYFVRRFYNGSNNSVFLVEGDKKKIVVKCYPQNRHDTSRRMQAEINLLNYASNIKNKYVPKLLDYKLQDSSIVLEFCDGISFSKSNYPRENHLNDAIQFLGSLNFEKKIANKYIPNLAIESFTKITQHLDNVIQRLHSFSSDHIDNNNKNQARKVIEKLFNSHNSVRKKVLLILEENPNLDSLRESTLRVSPVDFVFHNAIDCKNNTIFFDFEYSGFDDPAKIYIDFFLQPKIPVSDSNNLSQKLFIALVNEADFPYLKKRISLLSPILFLKWCCIILAFLNPSRDDLNVNTPKWKQQKLDFFLKYWDKNSFHINM